MKPVTVSANIDRPPEDVYDYLAVLANHEAFTDHFIVDWHPSGPASGVGATVRATVQSPGSREEIEVVVVEAERPSTVVERTTAAGGKRVTRGTYRLSGTGAGHTRVTLEVALERGPAVERLVAPLVRAWIRRVNVRALDRLRALLEAAPQRA